MMTYVKQAVISLAMMLVVASSWAAASSTIEERLKPAGELCMAGDACASAAVQVAAAGGERSGEDVYGAKCAMCHTSGAAGAPKFADVDAWASRISKGNETLYTNAIKGFNGMPAKGLCFDCSDAEIKAAVDHMVVNAQ